MEVSYEECAHLDPIAEWEKVARRRIVTTELMMLYGHDLDGYLPPLPQQERPKSSLARAWMCDNPAMRQLGNLTRRGPRSSFTIPQSPTTRKPKPEEAKRPHTAYTNQVREVLNLKFEQTRPHTSRAKLESLPFQILSKPPEDTSQLIQPKKITPPVPIELDIESMSSHSGLRRPRWGNSVKRVKKKSAKRGREGSAIPSARNTTSDLSRMLNGDIRNLPDEPPTAVRIYLSALEDFLEERKYLEENVYPACRKICAEQGLDFLVVDPRAVQDEQYNLGFSLRQIDKCHKSSMGASFVVLLGDRYGEHNLPLEVEEDHFEAIMKVADLNKLEDSYLLREIFEKDLNTTPIKYSRKQTHGLTDAELSTCKKMFTDLLSWSVQAGKITDTVKDMYQCLSDQAAEIVKGVFQSPLNPAHTCLYFRRKFSDVHKHLDDEIAPIFIDVDSDGKQVNTSSRDKLQELDKKIKESTTDGMEKEFEIPWTGAGIDVENEDHVKYLDELGQSFMEGVKNLIYTHQDMWKVDSGYTELYHEVLHHAKICANHYEIFVERPTICGQIESYFSDAERCVKPLVIMGASGVGKSAMLSSIVPFSKKLLGPTCIPVYRYLGTSTGSSDLTKLMLSLCLHISAVYNMERPPREHWNSPGKMVENFHNALNLVEKHHSRSKPLVLLLDNVDTLSSEDRANTLYWLPRQCPKNIFIVTTVRSDSYTTIRKLSEIVNSPDNLLEIGNVSAEESALIIEKVLASRCSALQEYQMDALKKVVCQGSRLALYTSSMAREAVRWHSKWPVESERIPQDIDDALLRLGYRLQDKYGTKLVKYTLIYLSMFADGLSEVELRDLLCSDVEVLEEAMSYHDITDVAEILHTISMSMLHLLESLQALLHTVHRDGKVLVQWAHPKYRSSCFKKFIGAMNPFTGRNENQEEIARKMLEVFSCEDSYSRTVYFKELGMEITINSQIMPQPLVACNKRKLALVPALINQNGPADDIQENLRNTCLCNFQWLLTSIKAHGLQRTLSVFDMVVEWDPQIDVVKTFLKAAGPGLINHPETLAVQIVGCMPCLNSEYYLVNDMIKQAEIYISEYQKPIIKPMYPAMPSPLNACHGKFTEITDIISFDKSGRLAVAKNENGYIEIWDMINEEIAFSLGVRFDKTTPNVFCSETKVLAIDSNNIKIYDIESGILLSDNNLTDILPKSISSLGHFCHTAELEILALHSSDDDFNQCITIVDASSGDMLHKIQDFDLKDEFFSDSAAFTSDGSKMVFIKARSEMQDDDTSADIVRLRVFDLVNGRIESVVNCGVKKFNKLILKNDELAIVSWSDCSYDVYDVAQGTHTSHLAAPDSRLTIQYCTLTSDDHLVALTSSTFNSGASMQYYALWYWNIDEQTSASLISQRFEKKSDIPKFCAIIEELHIAVLATHETAKVTIWDLPNSECIATFNAHTHDLDNIIATSDPYKIYSAGSDEEIVKLWDLHTIIHKTKESSHASSPHPLSRSSSKHSIMTNSSEGILKPSRANSAKPGSAKKSVRFADESDPADVQMNGLYQESTESLDTVSDATEKGRDEYAIITQLKYSKGVTYMSFSKDCQLLLTTSDKDLPVLWEISTGQTVHRLDPPYEAPIIGCPWGAITANNEHVVGLTTTDKTYATNPYLYKYQVWSAATGEPMHTTDDQHIASTCCLTTDLERAVICVLGTFDITGKVTSEICFKMLSVASNEVLLSVQYKCTALPTQIQITADALYVVTNNVLTADDKKDTLVFKLDKNSTEPQQEPKHYEYMVGKKYTEYRATSTLIVANGLAVANGLKGDLQLWDIGSCEYEGNLYHDRSVKDTNDPSLHNHGGKKINHMVGSDDSQYLLVGAADNTATLWGLDDELLLHTYRGHTDEVTCVCISRDNKVVITASADKTVCIWKFGKVDRPITTLYVHYSPISVQISLDKRTLVLIGAAKNEENRFMMFRIKNRKQLLDA